MLNVPGKEMDLLRVTVKVPGKRPPRAVPPSGLPGGPNGRVKEGQGAEGVSPGKELFVCLSICLQLWIKQRDRCKIINFLQCVLVKSTFFIYSIIN